MIVIQLMGGLGNQMFQYAFGRYLSIKYKIPLFLDKSVYTNGQSERNFDLEIFKIKNVESGEIVNLNKYNFQHYFQLNEHHFHFDSKAFSVIKNISELTENQNYMLIIHGYWQSYRYFKKIEPVIRKDFKFSKKLNGKWHKISTEIKKVNAVMINVRRGDYLQKLDYHGVVDISYLTKAIKYLRKKVENPVFYVFSDDMPGARKT